VQPNLNFSIIDYGNEKICNGITTNDETGNFETETSEYVGKSDSKSQGQICFKLVVVEHSALHTCQPPDEEFIRTIYNIRFQPS